MIKNKPILLTLVLIAVAFIWIQSALPAGASNNESEWFKTHIVEPVYEFITGKPAGDDLDVRKPAHVAEYFVFAALLSLSITSDSSLRNIAVPVLLSFFAAFIDESIQIFSGRGSSIKDVWIDFTGAFFGILTVRLIKCILSKSNRER